MKPGADSACDRCHGTGFVPLPPNDRYPNGAWTLCACRLRIKRQRTLQHLLALAGLTQDTMHTWSFDTFDPQAALTDAQGIADLAQIKAHCQAYARNPQGWLILCGTYGCGKSHLAYATISAFHHAGHPVYACTVPELLETLRQGYADATPNGTFTKRFAMVRDIPLLLLDDLGAEHPTPWGAEKLYQIIDYRHRQRLPLIVTTNVNLYDAKNRIEHRVLSRLLNGANLPHGFSRLYIIRARDFRQRPPQPT